MFFPALPPRVSEPASRQSCTDEPTLEIALLTARMARQDESAYRQFYARYFDRLLRYLLVVTGGREEAARDALQATMLRVVRHARRFDSEEIFWSWLTVLARSSVVDAERKHKRYFAVLDRFLKNAPSPHVAAPTGTEDRFMTLLANNLNGLSAEDRQLIECKYFESQSVREIAGKTGATEKAVESRLARIRRQLKESILSQLREENET